MRPVCLRCRRPSSVCYCRELVSVPTRTRVVFLQHPRERRVAIGTARMAHLALPNSELHSGVVFDDHADLAALLSDPAADAAVLYPVNEGEEVRAPARVPRTLVVVDGTWTQARKVLAKNPLLSALPRWGLRPSKPGNYRIRREPAAHCLSTIEAVVEALGQLEGPPERFEPMLHAFTRMVDRQIECEAARTGPPRKRRRRARAPRAWNATELKDLMDRLVLIHAEANAPAVEAVRRFDPELVQLCAVRASTDARFEMFVAPRHVLAEATGRHLEVSASQLMSGATVEAALERWTTFLRTDDVLVSWGTFSADLLEAMGADRRPRLNLRPLAARALNRAPGGVQSAALQLGAEPSVAAGSGRAGRRLAALQNVLRGLLEARFVAPRGTVGAHDPRD